MKNLFLFLLLLLIFSAFILQTDSFIFMDRELVFGISPETFLKEFPEFKILDEHKSDNQLCANFIQKLSDGDVEYKVCFENSALSVFNLFSTCTNASDQKIIDGITNQFKLIPLNESEEEMGDIVETYKKGNLTATAFIGGFYMLTINKNN